MILAGTGHRPDKLGGYDVPNPIFEVIYARIGQALDYLKPDRVISGMALGFDQWLAAACIEKDIPFTAAVPFIGYDSLWPARSRQIYSELLQHAAEINIISHTAQYEPRLLHVRNEWMVNASDQVLALWNGSQGGTASCVRYATLRGKQVQYLQFDQEFWNACRAIEQQIAARRANRRAELGLPARPSPRVVPATAVEPGPAPDPLPSRVESNVPTNQEKFHRRSFSVGRKIDMDD